MSESPFSHLAEIARAVQASEDVTDAATAVVAAALELVPNASGVAVTLAHRRGRIETRAASSDKVRWGDELQYELNEGPCLDAVRHSRLVYAPDLGHDRRWPAWAPRVAEKLGVKSMLCLQLFTDDSRLGALNIYSDQREAFDSDAQDLGLLLAAQAAAGVAAAQQIQTLQVAVDHRTTIGKAIGLMMAKYDLDDGRAFQVLQRWSSHRNRKIHELAAEIVLEHDQNIHR